MNPSEVVTTTEHPFGVRPSERGVTAVYRAYAQGSVPSIPASPEMSQSDLRTFH